MLFLTTKLVDIVVKTEMNDVKSFSSASLITLLVSGLLLVFMNSGLAQASTDVSGVIGSDTKWTKAGSPYSLVGNVLVENGATLTIEAGATVNLNDYYIMVNGTLRAQGTETEKIRRYLSKKDRTATANSIKDLRTGMHHVNLKAKILEVAEPRNVVTRYGNHACVAKALIADETGTINLCLWNGQIASVSAGDTVQIENAQVSSFRGEKHMTLGKTGTLSNVENFKPQAASIDLHIPTV